MVDQSMYALPGISNPVVPVKANKLFDTKFNGSVRMPIYGPIPASYPEPDLKVYITLDFGREIEIQYASTNGDSIFKKMEANMKSYWLNISTDDLLLSRGSYKVRVVKDDEVVKEMFLRSHNTEGRPDTAEYNWKNAEPLRTMTYDYGNDGSGY